MSPRMDAKTIQKRLRLFVGVSVLLHLLVLAVLYFLPAAPKFSEPKAVFVDLNSITPQQLAQMMQEESPKQVVESELAQNTEAPKDAKYLGERSQTAEQETKAKMVDSFRKGGNPSMAGNQGKSLSLKDLAPKSNNALRPPTEQELDGYQQEKKKYNVAQNQDSRMGNQSLDNPGSATNDYLKDVKEGDRTMLSTKEFVYFSYYRRIRERLEVAWNSRLRSTLQGYMSPGGRQLASNRDYVTGVIVVLDRNGTITAVQLQQQSGAKDLDQAAVDAFNEAGPFPDPPAGLVDEKGEIRIPWNFILQS